MSRMPGIIGPSWRAVIPLFLMPLCLALGDALPEPPLVWYGVVRNGGARVTSGTLMWTVRPEGGGAAVTHSTELTNLIEQFSYLMELPCESEVTGLTASLGALKLTTPATRYSRVTVTLDGQPLYLSSSAIESFTLDGAARGQIERLDLSFTQVDPDSDGDGLPDWWESQFPGGDVAPDDDFDRDGASNEHEYLAGTNPQDESSFFFIVIYPDETGSYPIIQWNGVAGRTYRLLRSEALISDLGGFIEVDRGIPTAPGGASEYPDTGATGPGPYFYLLQVEE